MSDLWLLSYEIFRELCYYCGEGDAVETSIGCSVIIHDDQSRVLIAQRSGQKSYAPLLWELVGGGLERGETPEQCIRREAREEIGCALHDLRLFDVQVHYEDICYLGIVYTATITGDPLPNEEIRQVMWVTKDELNQYEFETGDMGRLMRFFAGVSV